MKQYRLVLLIVVLGLVAVFVEFNTIIPKLVAPVETAVPVAVVTPACAACVACAAPIVVVATPTPAVVLPTLLPPDSPVSVGTVAWTNEEIVQVLWENERVRKEGAGEEGDVELRFDPQPELPWWTQLADDRKLLLVLYTTDPRDHGQVVVVLEEGASTAWIIKRPEIGRYQVFPWQLWNVPGDVQDLGILYAVSDDELGLYIRYTVEGVPWPIQREISVNFPLG